MRKSISILSVFAWLSAVWIITLSPFSIMRVMGRFNSDVLIFFAYEICGVALAAIAGTANFRWARLTSFGWSIPAALWYFPGLLVSLGWLFGRGDPCPDIIISVICFGVLIVIVSMPVFWGLLCFKFSRGLTNR